MLNNLVKATFNALGFNITRKITRDPNKSTVVKVGKFDITINGKSWLDSCYLYSKDYGAQLTRLAAVLNKNFSSLKAIDIGANQGDSVALIKSGADVPVICVEGDSNLVEQFNFNTAQFANVTLIKTFLTDAEVEMECTYTNVGHNLTIMPATGAASAVSTKFLSVDFLYKTGVLDASCKLLKVDTEGFDLKILRGSAKFLADVKPAILFEFNKHNLADKEADPYSIFAWLENLGYNQILFYESDGRFMFSSNLANYQLMKQMFDYVDGKNSKIYYLDIVVFHSADDAVANEFINGEEVHRLQS
ncbi:FkbM family methyltransferase [Mucilaginibacter sp.]|uniref:FkbM family methyltransferase n=1 Tax=Mucilaginibacter sp. TaxID=1882438 RepID=UPI003267E4D6